jgi:hypothetical protein
MNTPPLEFSDFENLTTKIELLINKWSNPVSIYHHQQFETLSYREGYNVLSTIAEFERQEQDPDNIDLLYLDDPSYRPPKTQLTKRAQLATTINVEKLLPLKKFLKTTQ